MWHFPVITRANLIMLQHFPVVTSFGAPSFFGLDRAAVPYFGIKVSGSLVPVYQLYVNLLRLWSKSLDTCGLIYILHCVELVYTFAELRKQTQIIHYVYISQT
jgi:hypothetical protein